MNFLNLILVLPKDHFIVRRNDLMLSPEKGNYEHH